MVFKQKTTSDGRSDERATKQMRCACTQPNSPNGYLKSPDDIIIIISADYCIFVGCLFVSIFLWFATAMDDCDWPADNILSMYQHTHTHNARLLILVSLFHLLPYLKLMCLPARPYWIMHFCGEIWWERELNKMERENKTKIHTRYDDRAGTNCTAIQWFRPKIVWLKAHYFRFDWWHRINFTVHRRQNEEIEFRDTGDFVPQLFFNDDDSLQTIELNNEKRYSLGDNLINTLRILQFNLMSSTYASVLSPHTVFVCLNFISLIELNGDHIMNAIHLCVVEQ